MTKNPIILGIETSCDETAISIIQDQESGIPKILSNIVSSQFDIHKEFGGVVPELAARSHVEKINIIARKAFKESGISLGKISAVASTVGPGLIICLSVGLNFGKAVSSSLNVPFIGINHLEGHALSPKLQQNLDSNSGSDTQDAIRLRYEIHKHYHRRQKAYENFQKHLKPKLVSK